MAGLLDPDSAVAIVLAAAPGPRAEPVPLDGALGRVTAEEVVSGLAVPPFDNSAMDGFALRRADTAAGSAELRVVAEARAGHPAARGPGAGEAVRISTGAPLPAGADAVVAVEDVDERGGAIHLRRAVEAGAHVRRAGEDVAAGAAVLAAGAEIGAAELGVLATVGRATVDCARRPRVALLVTGDELVAPGRPLRPGEIHDAGSHTLRALATAAGAEIAGVERVRDDPAATRAAVERALATAEVVVACGGVSVGPHDHVKAAFAALGVEQRFWRVALRPGKPTWFGVGPARPGEQPPLVFGLPGNPVSAMVTFHVFVRPALRAALGLPPRAPRLDAVLEERYRKALGRVEYARCRAEPSAYGWHVRLTTPGQQSHRLTSMLGANALAVLPADRDELVAGERVELELL